MKADQKAFLWTAVSVLVGNGLIFFWVIRFGTNWFIAVPGLVVNLPAIPIGIFIALFWSNMPQWLGIVLIVIEVLTPSVFWGRLVARRVRRSMPVEPSALGFPVILLNDDATKAPDEQHPKQ